jgi:hypothetical protein
VIAAGDLAHLANTVEDIGFRDAVLVDAAPPWATGLDPPGADGVDWDVWITATPIRSASLSRDLSDELTVLDAWPAYENEEPSTLLHPYAVQPAPPEWRAGMWCAFGVAYPVER